MYSSNVQEDWQSWCMVCRCEGSVFECMQQRVNLRPIAAWISLERTYTTHIFRKSYEDVRGLQAWETLCVTTFSSKTMFVSSQCEDLREADTRSLKRIDTTHVSTAAYNVARGLQVRGRCVWSHAAARRCTSYRSVRSLGRHSCWRSAEGASDSREHGVGHMQERRVHVVFLFVFTFSLDGIFGITGSGKLWRGLQYWGNVAHRRGAYTRFAFSIWSCFFVPWQHIPHLAAAWNDT